MRKFTITAAMLASCGFAASALAADPATTIPASTIVEASAPSTTIGGVAWFDFSHISLQNQNSSGVYTDVPPTGTGFDVKRFYLIVDHKFDDVWSANLTTDAQYSTASTTSVSTPSGGTTNALTNQNSSGNVTEVYIKKLYLQGKFDPAFVLRVGSADLPWIPWVEGVYGYRFVDKLALDRLGLGTTADWGINANGNINGELFSYSVSMVNGGGYKNPTRTKDLDFEGRISSKPVSWLTLGVGFYSGHLGQITAANENYPSNTASRFDALAAVSFQGLKVGVEYFTAKNYKTVNNLAASAFGTSAIVTSSGAPPVSDKAEGASVFASYAFMGQWSVFGRYDGVKPSKDVATNLKDEYYNLGIDYKPIKPLDVALVYKNEKVKNGSISVSGFDAGGSVVIGGATGAYDGKYDEIGVYCSFKY
jgi:hypothetical protein